MTRFSNVAVKLSSSLTSALLVAALIAGLAPEASAQSKDQQACVNALNKAGAKVAATQGKENSACIKDGGSGNLDQPTVDLCVTADAKGKVGKAELKTTDAQTKKCSSPLPTFGFTGAGTINTAAVAEEVALLEDVFGAPVNTAIIMGGDGAKCQANVTKSFEKLGATRLKEFNNCKKAGLKGGTISNSGQLQTCISSDPKLKVSGAATKLTETVTKSCEGVTLATAFPGCSAESGNDAALSGCIERNVECHMCQIVNAMDALSIGCDQFDDGVVNQTCRQCGNGATEAPEFCDDGGNSVSCDSDCTAASCGDGFTNAVAGEACDTSGETAGCDDDCSLPVCQDGNLNTLAGEVCDDGNNTNGDGCDNNCTPTACGNGIHTLPEECDDGNVVNTDACLNSCVAATCGDTVTCSGVGCTSGPSGGVETCDDGDVDDNDSCRNNCGLATCGDGVLCNQVGCTTGPSSGLELCDNGGSNSNVTPDACRTSCAPASCGDSVTDAGETCDGGGNTPSCDSDCTTASCGDGFVNSAAGETCDTSGESLTCDANCTAAVCGDGTINATAGELCDDGNANSGDGCSSTCQDGPGSGEQDAQCPDLGQLVLYSKLTNQSCVNNGDCTAPRTCDPTLLLCTTIADLDSGWNGAGHDADINDGVTAAARLLCEGPDAPGCGECTVEGLDPGPGNCRCANNILNVCDQPFVADADDCGGAVCDCYFGAPFPLSSAGTPVCVSNRFSQDITGTANVDLGAGAITANLRTRVFLGLTTDMPCPVCGGQCSGDNSGCIFDSDCAGPGEGGTCVQDTPGDGIRDGLCVYDPNTHTDNGVACDSDGTHSSFPAIIGNTSGGSGGGGYSIDCQPTVGVNVSGQGLKISLNQTTGTTSLGFGVDCDGSGVGTDLCPCLTCSKDNTEPCSSDAGCASQGSFCSAYSAPTVFNCTSNTDCGSVNLGTCTALGNVRCSLATSKVCATNADCLAQPIGPCVVSSCSSKGGSAGVIPEPNDCAAQDCTDQGGGEGECTTGPDQLYCDALVRSDGSGINACLNNGDCSGGYGLCTLADRADCFLDPIEAVGAADPEFPVAGAVFCIPPTSNGGINAAAGLPGPGRVVSQGAATTFCASDHGTEYTPGVGGCP